MSKNRRLGDRGRYSSASKADILSRALGEVIQEKRSNAPTSSKRGSSTVSRSLIPQRALVNSSMNAKTYRDIDSQADRYRDTIRAMEALQVEAQGHNQTYTKQGQVYPTPVREGVFDRNKKYDGVKYADNKTRARRFELNAHDQAYNPSRMVAVSAADAIIDPHVTIRHEQALPAKDPGYYPL